MASSSHIISPMQSQSQSQSQSQQQQHQHQPHSHPQPHQPQRKCGSSSSVATSAAFVLRLPDHQKELHQFIWQLFDDGMHTDCELSLDDGQYIRAHKLILSAFSPYFRQLLTRVSSAAHHTSGSGNSHYPVIIVKDVLYDDLRSLVEFMYRGQVTVADDRLPQVLKCAKQLKVRGLYENNTVNGNAHHYEYQPHVNHRNHVLSSQTSIHQKPVESVEMCNKIACNNASCNTNNNNTNNINTVNHVNHNNNSNTSTVNHINNANHVNTTTNHVNNNNSNNNNCKEVNMVEVKKPKAEPIPSSVYASPDRVIATNGRNDYVAEWLTKKLNPPNSFVNPITIPSLQQKIALDLSKSQSRHLSVPDHCLPPMASSSPYHYLHPGLFRSTSVDETRLTANMVQMNEKRKAASSLDGHLDNDTKAGSDENASFNNGDDLSTGSKDKKRNLNIFHAAKYRNRKKQQLDALFQEEIELQKQTIMSKMQIEKLESMILTLIWQQTKRSIDSNAQTVFTCPVCGNVQKEVSRLRSHINMLHNDTEALMKFLMLQRSPHQSTLQSTTTSVITTSTTMPSNSNNNNNNSSNSCGNSVPFHINITNNNNSNNNTIINNTNSNNNNNNSS